MDSIRVGRVFALLLAGSACLGIGGAQITAKQGAYQFRARYRKNQTLSYSFNTLVTTIGGKGSSAKQNITLPVVMKVLEVRGGVAKIRNEVGPWLMNGKTFRSKSNVTVFVDSLNRLVGDGPADVPQFSAPLPEKPIKVGGTWSSIVTTAGSTPQTIQVKATYKLLRVAANRAYVGIQYSGGGTGKSTIKTSGQGSMTLNAKDGMLESMDVMQTVTLSPGVGARTVILVKRTS